MTLATGASAIAAQAHVAQTRQKGNTITTIELLSWLLAQMELIAGSNGSGSGTTPADIATGIQNSAAVQSIKTSLDTNIPLLLDGLEVVLGTATDIAVGSGAATISSRLRHLSDTLNSISPEVSFLQNDLEVIKDAFGLITNPAVNSSTDGSLMSRLKGQHTSLEQINTNVTSTSTAVTQTNTTIGIPSDTAVTSAAVGSVSSRLRGQQVSLEQISTATSNTKTNTDTLVTNSADQLTRFGNTTDAAAPSTSNASLLARTRNISASTESIDNKLTTTNTNTLVLGTNADAAANSSVNGTVSARLRSIAATDEAINNKLTAVGSNTDTAVSSGVDGSLLARQRGMQVLLEVVNAVLGITTDGSIPSSVTGTLMARLRGMQANLEAIAPTADPLPNLQTVIEVAGTASVIASTPAATAPSLARLSALYNANGGTQHWLQLHVRTTTPVTGAVPVQTYRMRANSTDIIDKIFWESTATISIPSGNVLYLVRSSTADTYTPVTLSAGNAAQVNITIKRNY